MDKNKNQNQMNISTGLEKDGRKGWELLDSLFKVLLLSYECMKPRAITSWDTTADKRSFDTTRLNIDELKPRANSNHQTTKKTINIF